MEKEKTILFLINTEFVLLVSYLYCLSHLKKNYKPIFAILNSNPNRFQSIHLEKLAYEHYVYKNELNLSKITVDKKFMELFGHKNVYAVALQNPHFIINAAIANYYKNLGAKLYLISDSIAVDRGYRFSFYLIHYLKDYFRKFINRIPYIPRIVWTYQNIIDRIDLLIAHNNIGAKEFINVNNLLNLIPTFKTEIYTLFDINFNDFENAQIIFFSQPILEHRSINNKYKDDYKKILSLLSSYALKYEKNVCIKVHPAENPERYRIYENKYLCVSTKNNLPAEILLNVLKNKQIVSLWSSVNIFDVNKKNHHYWLYKVISYPLITNFSYANINYLENYEEIEQILFKNNIC